MRVGTPGFVPERLIQARAAKRIATKTALARVLGVSDSTVSRWENGSISPDPDMLTELAKLFYVRREFFLRPVVESQHPMFHRALTKTLARDIDYQHAQMAWLQEISSILQHYIDFPPIDIPDVMGGAGFQQLRDEDIETIASDLRRHWRLGEGPCVDVVALLEKAGFIVGAIEMGTSRLDGLCSWHPDDHRPHILLANDKMSFVRRQMDAAHEMAHAVLHRGVSFEDLQKNLKEIERQAFRLASAFLMPASTYPAEVARLSLNAFVSLKARWRVSIKAQIKRLSDLEIIPPDMQRDLYKTYSAKGWNKREPFDDDWSVSQPRLLADAVQLIVDGGVRSKADLLAVEFTMSPGDVENLTNLPAGWFNERTAEIVQLKKDFDRSEVDESNHSAIVIPFNRR